MPNRATITSEGMHFKYVRGRLAYFDRNFSRLCYILRKDGVEKRTLRRCLYELDTLVGSTSDILRSITEWIWSEESEIVERERCEMLLRTWCDGKRAEFGKITRETEMI